eukprot:CAMPEP_0181284306 /NCGR_PEP_ID=MMETSP1097-20121128/15316_1 /TAXON_ID=35684 /ORGANISM="Pseudopedinella elastica, Strain CCMP716" /LENGTH=52 /DNA_ID=CAMNT_0023387697 /DNA_START=115 /DNA_END=270 /DNA_ORIENTATION=+
MTQPAPILRLVLQGRADDVVHQLLNRDASATVIPGVEAGRVSDRHGFRGGKS